MVANAAVPHITVDPPAKFVPVTVSVNAALPAAAEEGLNEASVGPLTLNALAGEEAALVFCTVTLGVPVRASWVLVTAAVSEVALP